MRVHHPKWGWLATRLHYSPAHWVFDETQAMDHVRHRSEASLRRGLRKQYDASVVKQMTVHHSDQPLDEQAGDDYAAAYEKETKK